MLPWLAYMTYKVKEKGIVVEAFNNSYHLKCISPHSSMTVDFVMERPIMFSGTLNTAS